MRAASAIALLFGLAAAVPAAAQDRCDAPGLTPIHALADAGSGSARLRGVVTAVFPGLSGYFIEAPRSDWDKSTTTTEGLFVYTGHEFPRLEAGDEIVLAGHYRLFHDMPELEHVRILSRCGRRVRPPAVTLERIGTWSALLGMRVRFTHRLTVAGLADAGRYGELRLYVGGHPFAPTALTAPGPGAEALARSESAHSLWLDDGSTHAPKDDLDFAGQRFDAAHPLRGGMELKQLQGIAFHAFGRNMLEPTQFTLDRNANPRRMPAALGLPKGLRVVSFNVENYFNHALSGPPFPTERGARSVAGFACQTRKLVSALAALHPALAGLQEIENDGYGADSAIAHLVVVLNHAVPDAHYRYVRPRSKRLGDDLIAPALIYDVRRLARVGRVAVLTPEVLRERVGVAAATGLSRPVLAASFKVRAGGLAFTAAVLHLRSKRSACGDGLDSRDGAGHCAGARAAAVAPIAHWLQSRPTGAATPNTLVLGDFNAYPKEAAITEWGKAGWVNLAAHYIPRETRYSESYRGRVGELDYIFANPPMAGHVAGATIWHNDADEAPALAYDRRFAACAASPTPWHASDHDPIIVVLKR
ncbi:MAG: ExeM/NucH family extracellular endonuclease [Gammaproteobacteria bacterium]